MSLTNYSNETTISDLFQILVRWRKLIVVTFFAVLIPALLVTFLMPPLYQATARVLISRQNNSPDYSLRSTRPEISSVHRTLDRAEEVNTYGEIIKSRSLVEAALDEYDVDEAALDYIHDFRRYVRAVYKGVKNGLRWVYDETKYALHLSTRPTPEFQALTERTLLVDGAIERMKIQPAPDSTILEVGFRSSDPAIAQKLVNAIVDRFVDHNAELRRADARDFFTEESRKMAADLREIETELDTLRATYNAYSVDDQRRLLLGFLADTENKAKAATTARSAMGARIAVLEAQLDSEPERILIRLETNRNPAIDALEERLVELQLVRSEKAQEFPAESVTIRKLDAQIEEAQALVQRLGSTSDGSKIVEINPVRQGAKVALLEARTEFSALRAEEESLQTNASAYRKELNTLGKQELRVRELERTALAQEEAYLLYIRNQEQARVTEGMASARLVEVRVVDYAPLPIRAVRPRRLLYSGIGLAAALLIALAAPFFAQYNDTTFSSERQVQQLLDLPVVASFPLLEREAEPIEVRASVREESV